MPDLKRCFEAMGFAGVRTILGSGNVVFHAGSRAEKSLEKQIEDGLKAALSRAFPTQIRRLDHLQKLTATDPFSEFGLEPNSKRVVTFLRDKPDLPPDLPLRWKGAALLKVEGREVFSAYVPSPEGPVFMTLIEKTFGKDVTTRTWDTVKKVSR